MPRMASAGLLALILCAHGAPTSAQDLGSPPSGEVPILFNDHHVYAKPDLLKRDRVLAALVKGGQIYVPLRSMFEQMGATVSATSDGKTVTATKPGASVSVTVGKSEVVINGETRPLDVPPMLYNGIVLVPVRVLSEALGAYVQWVPSKQVVVVRYIPPMEVPPPAPTAAPTAAPTPVPVRPTPVPTAVPTIAPTIAPFIPAAVATETPRPRAYGFVQGALSATANYNEFAAGGFCDTLLLSGAYAFSGSPFALKVNFRQDAYVTSNNVGDLIGNRYTQFATIDGGTAFTPVFLARQNSLDVRAEYQIAAPRVYVGVAYLHTSNNYGYPNLNAVGAGIEKLPDLRRGLNLYGSVFYYPSASGTFTVSNPASPNFGKAYQQRYQIVKYDLGLAYVFGNSPVYINGGFSGDQYSAGQNAPVGQIHAGPYLGLGVKI
jgi:hypothetical protein